MATDTIIKCSKCGSAFSIFDENEQVWLYPGDTKYCPDCGASFSNDVVSLRSDMQAIFDLAQRFLGHDSRCSKEPLHLMAKINNIAERHAFRKNALYTKEVPS